MALRADPYRVDRARIVIDDRRFLGVHADVFSNSTRGGVIGMNDRHEPVDREALEREFKRRGRSLGRDALVPDVLSGVPPDFSLGRVIERQGPMPQ